MDAAVFGSRTDVRLELRPVLRPHGSEAPELPSWQVHLTGRGLSAVLDVEEAGWEPTSLADFLGALARDWRGWDGEREWQSAEAELRLTARHDKTNTVLVTVEIEEGAPPRWRCEAELELEPGAFHQLAEDVRSLSRA
jgi:hypothetical protein